MIESFVFLGLSLNAWITIVLVLVMFGLLLFTKLPADVVFVGGMAVLLVCGVLPAKEVLSGFSSESVVVVGVLFVVVAGLVYTGVLQWIVRHLLGNPSSYPKAIV
ncbi:SLC13 family permease, partial [Bacteroides cellulosilyticus]